MNSCARCELHISALLDGEAAADEVLFVIDHLPSCAACRDFLRASRRLESAVAAWRTTAEPVPASSAAAEPVPASSATPEPAASPTTGQAAKSRFLPPRWAGALAAGVVFALLWLGGARLPWLAPPAAPGPATMTEERFIEFARVLLEAEPRYRQSMLSLLLQNQPGEGSFDAEERTDEGSTTAPPAGTNLDFASTDLPAGTLPR